jgi:hypothetical protein
MVNAPCRHAAIGHACKRRIRVRREVSGGTLPAMRPGMARARAAARALQPPAGGSSVRIEEECLQLDVAGSREIDVLRSWQRRVNGATYPQPYLVEGPPGRFRLYVGAAAERVRTRRGID